MSTLTKTQSNSDVSIAAAYKFILLLGATSLFADMTYESARSINGQYLATLGANATIVGCVAGFGELVGYALRMVSGYLAEKTGRYWTITIIGYLLNLLSVPLLALSGYWQIAAILIVVERFGKAIRTPARDAMLSHAGHRIGFGWAFGLHEALDHAGAMIGPLVIALMILNKHSYQFCFGILLIPALLALTALLIASIFFPKPRDLDMSLKGIKTKVINSTFWLYLVAAGLIAAGYADFSLMAYHFVKTGVMTKSIIPFSYAAAMGVSAITAPVFGHLYDKFGFIILIIITFFSILFAPLVFLGDETLAFLGVIIWSLGMGSNETLMRAIVANMTSPDKRGSAYGIFNMGYGIAWFIGSVILGILYDLSIPAVVIFSVAIQLIAIPLFWSVMNRIKNTG
jgi:MFS family permease